MVVKPAFEELAFLMKEWVRFALVDCTVQEDFCRQQSIQYVCDRHKQQSRKFAESSYTLESHLHYYSRYPTIRVYEPVAPTAGR